MRQSYLQHIIIHGEKTWLGWFRVCAFFSLSLSLALCSVLCTYLWQATELKSQKDFCPKFYSIHVKHFNGQRIFIHSSHSLPPSSFPSTLLLFFFTFSLYVAQLVIRFRLRFLSTPFSLSLSIFHCIFATDFPLVSSMHQMVTAIIIQQHKKN